MTASGTPVAAALAGVVEEVGAATLLVVVASCRPRVVEFVVLRAREEVEVERRVRSTRWRVAMLVRARCRGLKRRSSARPARRAPFITSRGTPRSVVTRSFAANTPKRAARARGQQGSARAKRARRRGPWWVCGRGKAARAARRRGTRGGTRGARLHDCAASKTSRAISSTFRSSFTEWLPLTNGLEGLPRGKLEIYTSSFVYVEL